MGYEHELQALKSSFRVKAQEEQRIASENNLEAEKNRAIFEKSQLPQMLQVIIDEKMIDTDETLTVIWGEHNLHIFLLKSLGKHKEILFNADLSVDDEIVVNDYQNSNCEEYEMFGQILPTKGIGIFISNVINHIDNNDIKTEHFYKKTIDTPREKEANRIEKEEKRKAEEKYQSEINELKNSFVYKYMERLVDSHEYTTPIIKTKYQQEKRWLRTKEIQKEIVVGHYPLSVYLYTIDSHDALPSDFQNRPVLKIQYRKNNFNYLEDDHHHYMYISYNGDNKKCYLIYEMFINHESKNQIIELNEDNISASIKQAVDENTKNYDYIDHTDSDISWG